MAEITVTFADGSKHVYENVPNSVTAEQAEARARQDYAGKQITALDRKAGEGVLDTAKRWAGDVGRAFLQSPTVQALQGVVAANPANLVVNKVLPQKQAPLTAQQVVEKLPARQEGYGTAAREGLGGFLSNPVGGIPAAVAEIAGNVGGEASAKLFGEGPLQRAGGALLTGGLTAAGMNRIGRLAPNVKDLAKESLEGIEPGQLELAKALMDRSQQQGVSMDLAQALSAVGARSGNMTTVRNVLANNKAGDRVQAALRAQPSELSVLADTTIARMPGRVYDPGQAANNLQEVATQAVDAAKKARTQAVRPLYEKAGQLGNNFRTAFADQLSEALQQPGMTEQAAAAIKDTLGKIKALPATGGKTELALDYDELIRSLRGPYKGNPLTPNDARTNGQLQDVAGKLTDLLRNASPETKMAAARYAQISQDVVDPLKQGPVGQLAGKRGYAADTQASTAKVRQIFEQGVDPQGPSPVRVLAKELAKVDKEAFADAAKTHYSGKVAEAFDPVIAGAPATNSDAAKRIWDSMLKNTKQYQGAKDTVASIAETYGQNPAQAVKGLENFAQITKALTNTTKVGGLAREEIFRLGGKNYGADALRVFGFLPFERAARRLEDRTMYNAFADFDKILTTPEGVDLLIKLSKQLAMSKEALTLIGVGQGAAVSAQTGANSPDVNRK